MATVEPKSLYNVNINEPQITYFTVAINTSGFLDTETVNGGRVSPCIANDFATKPTTLAQSLLVSRGNLRWKMMMEALAVRSNFRVCNIVTTYAADEGDSPITNLAFGLVFDTPNFVPTTGTTIDGSTTTTTRALYLQDKIAEALNTTRTENMSIFDPTGTGNPQQLRTIEVTAGPVLTASIGEIVEAITVTEVTGFAPNTSNQLPTDNSLTYSAE
jgi:hypothetical protein|tara:strand:- start:50 stop:697 length:648 start_codon:yes stop_codon:yes gene_type:complete